MNETKLRIEKVISVLPSTLVGNTMYFVRTGEGVDLYITDITGSVAYTLNNISNSSDFEDLIYKNSDYSFPESLTLLSNEIKVKDILKRLILISDANLINGGYRTIFYKDGSGKEETIFDSKNNNIAFRFFNDQGIPKRNNILDNSVPVGYHISGKITEKTTGLTSNQYTFSELKNIFLNGNIINITNDNFIFVGISAYNSNTINKNTIYNETFMKGNYGLIILENSIKVMKDGVITEEKSTESNINKDFSLYFYTDPDVAIFECNGVFVEVNNLESNLYSLIFSGSDLTKYSINSSYFRPTLTELEFKLQELENSTLKANIWTPVELIGEFNFNYYDYIELNGVKSNLEIAKIDGYLWIRGTILVKVGNNVPLLKITDNDFKCYCFNKNFNINYIDLTIDGSFNQLQFKSTSEVTDITTANTSQQFISPITYGNNSIVIIKQQPIGKLIIP